MKIIIAGSREFNNFSIIEKECNHLLRDIEYKTIISGTCRGVDKLGEQYADKYLLDKVLFPANWKRYLGGAGYQRNEQMALYADRLIAFWDGKSYGTKMMIELAKKNNLKIAIIKI
jgi:hypothetical protein